jgi:hypothetical protein
MGFKHEYCRKCFLSGLEFLEAGLRDSQMNFSTAPAKGIGDPWPREIKSKIGSWTWTSLGNQLEASYEG